MTTDEQRSLSIRQNNQQRTKPAPRIKMKIDEKISEEIRFLTSENFLLSNYLRWIEQRFFPNDEPSNSRSTLSVERKRQIAETIYKVLERYRNKSQNEFNERLEEFSIDEQVQNERVAHFENEISVLNKFYKKTRQEKRTNVKTMIDFFNERIHFWVKTFVNNRNEFFCLSVSFLDRLMTMCCFFSRTHRLNV